MPRNRTIVHIDGRNYTLAGDEREEYMHEVAILVDRKMREIRDHSDQLNTAMTAVLTAVNLADELIREKQRNAELERQIREQFSSKAAQKTNANHLKPINRTSL